jgi:hypothetical protein
MGATRSVCTHGELGLSWIDRELIERVVEHGHQIGRFPRRGAARTQHPGQVLTGGIQVGHDRAVAVASLVGRPCSLLLRVSGDDDGGVEVDYVVAGVLLGGEVDASTTPVSPTRRAFSRTSSLTPAGLLKDPG